MCLVSNTALTDCHCFRALVELTKRSDDGSVSIEDFKKFCKTHQALLARPFAVQDKLRTYTLGEGAWEKVSERRIEVRKGMTVRLSDLMTLVTTIQKIFLYLVSKW